MRRAALLSATLATTFMVATACGGGAGAPNGAGPGSVKSPTRPLPKATRPAVVSVAGSSYGKVLVDGRGYTLYAFGGDKGSRSMCYGTCAATWTPLTTAGAPQARGDAVASYLGTTRRKFGTTQVTYRGHPLYYYAGDTRPGVVNGEKRDRYGAWYVLSPSGRRLGAG